jgi:hypothetical protein
METDVSQRGTEKHPVDFYQNQGDAGSRGEEIPFRTDLPSSDQMFDEKGNLKPEIRSETDKATQLSNEIPKIQAAEREKGLQVRGPAGATMEDQSGGGEVVGDGVNSDAFFNQNEERSIK